MLGQIIFLTELISLKVKDIFSIFLFFKTIKIKNYIFLIKYNLSNEKYIFFETALRRKTIYLQKLGELDRNILEKLKKKLKRALKDFIDAVEISLEGYMLLESDYDIYRKQYNASSILNNLVTFNESKNRFRTLGIIDKDIFTGSYNFVFGVAKTPSKSTTKYSGVAIISLIRLREAFYDRPRNIKLFELRTLKEAIHEIGHTFGLDHCNNYCIMKFSNHLRDTDNKPPEFCERCLKELKDFLKETN